MQIYASFVDKRMLCWRAFLKDKNLLCSAEAIFSSPTHVRLHTRGCILGGCSCDFVSLDSIPGPMVPQSNGSYISGMASRHDLTNGWARSNAIKAPLTHHLLSAVSEHQVAVWSLLSNRLTCGRERLPCSRAHCRSEARATAVRLPVPSYQQHKAPNL
jgi:hypothetical protein